MKFHLYWRRWVYWRVLDWAYFKILILLRESFIAKVRTRRRGNRSIDFLLKFFLALLLWCWSKDTYRTSLWKWILSLNIKVWIAFRTTSSHFKFPWPHLPDNFGLIWINHWLSKQVKRHWSFAKLLLRFLKLINNHLSEHCLVCVLLSQIRFYIVKALCDIQLVFPWSFYHLLRNHQIAQTFKSCAFTTMSRFSFLFLRYLVK